MRQYLQDLSPQVQLAVEKFIGVGLSDPVFVQALLLANSRGFGHVLTLQFMAATTATLGPIEWKVLGFPSPARCTALVADLLDLAEALENRRIDCESSRITCGSCGRRLEFVFFQPV